MAKRHASLLSLHILALLLILTPGMEGLSSSVVRRMWENIGVPVMDVEAGEVSTACLDFLQNRTMNDTSLALDAFGKVPAGVLVGNSGWLGHFDECEDIMATTNNQSHHSHQYCLVELNVSLPSAPIPAPPVPDGDNVITMKYGLCVPLECDPDDVVAGIDHFLDWVHLKNVQVRRKPWCTGTVTYSSGFIITVTLFSLLFLVVICSSIYYSCQEAQGLPVADPAPTPTPDPQPSTSAPRDSTPLLGPTNTIIRIISGRPETAQQIPADRINTRFDRVSSCFALPRNIPVLMSGNSPQIISCLNGMRVISLLWVILAHTFSFVGTFTEPYNPRTGKAWFSRFMFTLISNPYFAVDSFFFISGLLVTYLTLNRMAKNDGKIRWWWFYLHRYLRLTPALAATILFYTMVTPYFGRGPFAQMMSDRTECHKYWWTNLLFINNFHPSSLEHECMPWVWYIANNVQFFIITPVILLPLYHIPWLGFVIMFGLMTSSIITTGILVYVYNFPAAPGLIRFPDEDRYWDTIFNKPYCRIPPYLIGIMIGYVFHRYPKNSVKMRGVVAFIGWTILGTLGGGVVNMVVPFYSGSHWHIAANVFYQMFCRILWTCYVGWVAFVCHYGYGGWVNEVLSHQFWAPLSRLTYSTFLLHPIIILLYLSSLGTPPYLSLQIMSFTFAGIALISYVCGALLTLLVEFPVANLERLFFTIQ